MSPTYAGPSLGASIAWRRGYKGLLYGHTALKEQCHEIIRLRFFHKTISLGPNRHAREFFRRFVELFLFEINAPAINTPGSQLESLRLGNFCKYKSHVNREVKVIYRRFLE